MPQRNLRRINNGLSLIVLGLSVYLLSAPLWPKVAFQFQEPPPLVVSEQGGEPAPPPAENTLVIPKINLQQTIHDGPDKRTLNRGLWHKPSATPGQANNMVLTGHRFTYGGPAVLYHLDKVAVGDEIIVYWQQQKHRYQVEQIHTVPPTNREVARVDTGEERLTIYTCTPLVTVRNRLVIQAIPLEGEDQP